MATRKYDIIIRNARIYDGTGNPWIHGSLAVRKGRVAAIGNLAASKAVQEFDAQGMVLCPGFIDVHTHADASISKNCSMEQYLRQGVTTIIGGNCGRSRYPTRAHLLYVSSLKKRINYGLLMGHATIREQVIGSANRAPSDTELRAMRKLCAKSLSAGAYGLSFGLYYTPGCYAEEREMLALAEEVYKQHGIVAFHLRDESDYSIGLIQSLKEALAVAEKTKARVHISHLKCLGKAVWGQAEAALSLVEQASLKGLDVSFDQYPYTASSTSLRSAIMPSWAFEGGDALFSTRLSDQNVLKQIRGEIASNIERRGGATNLLIATHTSDTTLIGKTLAEIAELRQMDPVDVAIELQLAGGARLVSFNMLEADVKKIMGHHLGLIASDGNLVQKDLTVPHPRSYGTFSRVLGKYVREEKILTLTDAIRKMTSAPARRLGLIKRGIIAEGFYADLVVFNPALIADGATFASPHQFAVGIELVIVNGKVVLKQGKLTPNHPGWTLKKLT
ncbi:MAG: D-aminoacylase [Peptococcaceae bacterium]|nr:D-aminoacylase [Peptococcaceae bacterium]